MHIKRTLFRGFRNIEPQGINWSPGLNLIVGSNGSGKTNLIEGLNLIAGWGPLEKGTQKYLADVNALGLDANGVYEKAKAASTTCKV